MVKQSIDIAEVRAEYARRMAAESGSDDRRLEQAFAEVPREDFVGPGPWMIMGLKAALAGDRYIRTPDGDPAHLYQNALVALDPAKGINNGEPFLHAAWIGAVAPQPGETVSHIGAGTGYYTAILAKLVQPGGTVAAYEIDPHLANKATRNPAAYDNVTLIAGDAVNLPLPASDIIYVNAGVAAPPARWLSALKLGGRLVFPWRPSEEVALSVLVTRQQTGLAFRPLMPSWFIPCIGASATDRSTKIPTPKEAHRTRSIWLSAERPPDESATAVFDDIWFSSKPIG